MKENDNTNRSCRKKKFKSWQMYCSTEESNPWNAIYETASGKLRSTTCLTTLQRSDGTFTLDTESTAKHVLDYSAPEDNEINDSAVHKQIRADKGADTHRR